MMNTISIAHGLINSGIERDHAEAIANALGNAFENQKQDLATKDFVDSKIQTLRAEISDLRGDMNSMESSLRGDMKALETRLVRWIVVTVFSGMGIPFAALRLFSG